MDKISEYTVLELIEKYKDIIGDDIEDFICNTIYEGRHTEGLKEAISIKAIIKNDKKARIRAAYSVLEELFGNNEEINGNTELKKDLLAQIIAQYQDRIKAKTKKEMKNLILEGKSAEIYKYPSKKYKGLCEYRIITDEEPKTVESIYDPRERRFFEQVINEVSINDLEAIIKSKYKKIMMDVIMKEVSIKYFLEKRKLTPEEYLDMYEKGRQSDDEGKIVIQFNEQNAERDINEMLREYLKTNFHLVDQEVLLLNAAAKLMLGIRLIQGEEIYNVSINKVEENERIEKIQASIISLKRVSKELKKNKYSQNAVYSIKDENEQEIITTDKKAIDDFLAKCTDTKYLSDEYIVNLHKDLAKGIIPEDFDELKVAGVEISDIINVMENYNKTQNDEEKQKLLKTAEGLTNYLKQNEKISNEDIISLYMDGNIDLKLLEEIDLKDLPKEYFEDKLLEIFAENVYLNNEETNSKIEKYGSLYSMLKKQGHIDTITDQIVERLSELFGEEFIPGIIDDLYKMKIANMQEALQWLGGEFLTEQYKQEKLKPVEIRELYDSETINFEELTSMVTLLKDNTEKFMVISSLFPEAENIEIRQELSEKCLDLGEAIKEDEKGTKRKKGDGLDKEYDQYITDPVARFMLMQLLDKDYSFKMTSDGHAIIHLPTFKKVIIEKMLDKDGRPYYGAATYIVDEKYFEKNKDITIVEDKVKRSKLSQNAESKSIEKLIHSPTGWGKGIKRVLEIGEECKTPEELQQIDEAIKSVEESRRKIERE